MSKRICSVPECGNPVKAKGWCNAHYTRMRTHGSLDRQNMDNSGPCKFLACELKAKSRGMCFGHWNQWRRGEELSELERRRPWGLTSEQAFWHYVKKSESCWIWQGAQTKGYGVLNTTQEGQRLAHRISYEIHHGEIPEGLVIDHMCHNPSCVNPSHLQAVHQRLNMQNLRGARIDSSTGIRGVSWNKRKRKWQAGGSVDGRSVIIGRYETIEEAERAAQEWRRQHYPNSLMDRRVS